MTIEIYNWAALDADSREDILERPAVRDDATIRETAQRIIDAVRERGDAALIDYARELDGAELDDLRVTDAELAAATAELDADAIEAIDLAIGNVRRFHEVQVAPPISIETMPGVRCERVTHAIEAVGLYVPAGTAPLPSAAIMLAVPAAIAGCPVRIMCTPPRPDGRADPAVIVAAARAGVTDIFKAGGAQAVAAMAYGTATIPKVQKIFGPGNAWFTSAKSIVSTDPKGAAIDLPAGPSEVLVIADDAASAELVASDLLSQAEHGVDSQVMLLATSAALAEKVRDEIEAQLATLPRAPIASEAIANSRAIVVDSIDQAVAISNLYAPEHLILQLEDARSILPDLRNAGSVFVGQWTPESVGDYCSGTNHVLPTYGFASTYSGLGVDQFMRQMTIQELTYEGLEGLGQAVIRLADLEGLDAHAEAVRRRLRKSA